MKHSISIHNEIKFVVFHDNNSERVAVVQINGNDVKINMYRYTMPYNYIEYIHQTINSVLTRR